MGKASRRRKDATTDGATPRSKALPFVGRPFEGLRAETEWVSLREILPAATATVTWLDGMGPEDAPAQATLATVLPLAWPGLHRGDGTVFVGMQSGGSSGDASRDLAAQLIAAAHAEPGTPVRQLSAPTGETPRLQDVLVDEPFEATLHDGFDFWVGDQELEGDAKDSLERANESVVPTSRMAALPSAFWVRIGERTHIRLVLGDDEDEATDALARLHAAGQDALGGGTRLLGAFRACGLLVPVWDLDPDLDAAAYEDELAAWGSRYAGSLGSDAPLTAEERRARSGLLSRQVTLR